MNLSKEKHNQETPVTTKREMDCRTFKAIVWIATAVAISVAVFVTKSGNPLFAFLIPAWFLD